MALKSKLSALFGLLFSLVVFENTHAEPDLQTSPPLDAGVTAYLKKDYEEARSQFMAAWKANPEDAAALTNLGLTAFQLGQKPWAIAYFRKALALDPGFFPANEGLKFVSSHLEVKEIPHKMENYEFVRSFFLVPVSEYTYFWLLVVLLFLFGWSILSYLGQKRRAFENDQPFPGFPWISVFSGVFCLVFFVLGSLKVYDLQIPRGTIVEEKVAAQSAPGESQLNLFDLYGGFEVIIRSQSEDWVQVTYPGAMTGWIKKSSVFVTSGGSPW